MTVTEYAKKYNVSKQSVYDKLKRGTLEYKTIQGIKHIILNAEIKQSINSVDNDIATSLKKKYKRALKKLNKSIQHIELLETKLESSEKLLISKDKQIITLEKSLALFTLVLETKSLAAAELIETKVKKSSKNKKKK